MKIWSCWWNIWSDCDRTVDRTVIGLWSDCDLTVAQRSIVAREVKLGNTKKLFASPPYPSYPEEIVMQGIWRFDDKCYTTLPTDFWSTHEKLIVYPSPSLGVKIGNTKKLFASPPHPPSQCWTAEPELTIRERQTCKNQQHWNGDYRGAFTVYMKMFRIFVMFFVWWCGYRFPIIVPGFGYLCLVISGA